MLHKGLKSNLVYLAVGTSANFKTQIKLIDGTETALGLILSGNLANGPLLNLSTSKYRPLLSSYSIATLCLPLTKPRGTRPLAFQTSKSER